MTTKQMKRAIYEIAKERNIDYRDGLVLNHDNVSAIELRSKDRNVWFLTSEYDGYHICHQLSNLTDSETEYVYNKLKK